MVTFHVEGEESSDCLSSTCSVAILKGLQRDHGRMNDALSLINYILLQGCAAEVYTLCDSATFTDFLAAILPRGTKIFTEILRVTRSE